MIVREFREAWRRLIKRPGYTLLSIGVLGAGLGVVLFVFGMVNTTVLQPFPFPQTNRLMAVGEPVFDGNGRLNVIDYIDSDQYLLLRAASGSSRTRLFMGLMVESQLLSPAVLAALLRAWRVDPAVAMRYE